MYRSCCRLGMDVPLEGKMVNKEWSNNKFLSFLPLALSLSSPGKGLKNVYSQASFNLMNEKFLEVEGWSTSAVFNWPCQRCCHILRYEVHSSKWVPRSRKLNAGLISGIWAAWKPKYVLIRTFFFDTEWPRLQLPNRNRNFRKAISSFGPKIRIFYHIASVYFRI